MSDGRLPADRPGSSHRSGSGELLVERCLACGHVSWPPRLLCPTCGTVGSEPVAAGPGVVSRRTETHTPSGEPVALATVMLDAGPWVIARAADAQLGARVRLRINGSDAVEAVQ